MMKKLSLVLALVVFFAGAIFAQRTITGKVTDESGEALIGASVLVKGSTTGTVTELDGTYSLRVTDGETVLVFSYTGYNPREVALSASNVVDVVLSAGITLETAFVTALGIERDKKALTYSVEKVDGDEIVNAREGNLVNALAGKFSGVQVTSSSGQAGSSARIIIRGNSSFLGNNEPLFVVDGVPVDNSQIFGGGQTDSNGNGNGDSPLFFGGTTNRIVDIDPNNVENISVLKGASATALYGSRAANGVVLITTKTGKRGSKPTVTLSSTAGYSDARLPKLQKTYAQGLGGVYFNGQPGQQISTGWGPRLDTLRLDADGNEDPNGTLAPVYDNAKDFFRRGKNLDNTLSIAGGGERAEYFVSYSNKLEEGIVPNNTLRRNAFLAKFGVDLTDKLNVSASVNYVNTKIFSITEGNGRQSYMWTVYGAPASYNLRGEGEDDYLNPDGTQRNYRTARNNPYFLVDNNGLGSTVNRVLPNLNVTYKFNDWLSLTNRVGTDYYTDRRLYREVVGTLGTFPTGRVYEDVITYQQVNNDLVLQANKRFNNFDLDVVVGSQINDQRTDRLFTQGVSLSVLDFFNLANASSITVVQNKAQERLVGAYASVSLGYRSFLYLTATGRNDWASTLPKESRSYFYPSISGSFIATDAFEGLQNNPILSFLKVRLGYAQVGNSAPAYATQTDLYVQSSVGDGERGSILFPFNGQNGFTISNIIGNPDLKPERTSEAEVGLEANFFKNRIRFEGSFYDRLSKDQIFQAPVAGSSGAVARLVNAGSMRNKGYELLLEVTPIEVGGFRWDIGGTFSQNKNTVESLTDGVDNIRLAGFTSPGIYIVRDEGYGVIWGSKYERDDQGRVLIDDDPESPGYGLPLAVSPNLGVIGSVLPDWTAGLRTTFSYSNEKLGSLSLTALMDIRKGGDILNLDNFYLNFYGMTEATLDRDGTKSFVFPNGVLSDGSTNNIQVPYTETYWSNFWGLAEEEWVEDGSFVRLREVTLSYRLPSSLLSNGFIRGLGVAVSGRNLWLHAPNFSGADPETSLYGSANGQGFYNFITPGTKGFNVSLNVTF